jgi:hypothetical protein
MFSRGRKKREEDLKEHGKRALGTILASRTGGGAEWNIGNPIGDTGTSHAVHLTIRVEPQDEAPFELHWKTRAQDGAIPQAGQTVVVWFDPGDHDRFTVELEDAAPVAEEKFGEFEQKTGLDVGALIGDPDAFRDALSGRPGVNPAQAVRQALNLSPDAIERAAGGAQHAAGPRGATPEDRLEKLGKLRAEGIVTQEEFEAQKAKILGES